MKPLTIDAHHHLWELGGRLRYDWLDQPSLKSIRRDYKPPDLHRQMQAVGIDRSIFVQTLADAAETRWALDQSTQYPFIAGVVGWVDLQSPDCQAQVENFARHPNFVGVRHVVHDEPDPDFIVRPAVIRGLQVLESFGIPYDLLLRVEHLAHVRTLAQTLPDLAMVIDHLAKPHIKSGQTEGWNLLIRETARFPNLVCKLSGMVTEADHLNWTVADLKPFFEIALDAFGPDRLIFGSDWPVCELAGSYSQVYEAACKLTADLSESEQAAIFGTNATRFYRLKQP